jgi:zinc finger SWIM domain-containing protein 3
LFEAFLNAHKGKAPNTFYMDQDATMGKAVGEVFAEMWHGLCTFHIMQNAAKHLHEEKDEEKKKDKKKEKKKEKEKEKNKYNKIEENEETSILSDFSAYMFEYEDTEEFEQKFDLIRKKVSRFGWIAYIS